MRLSDAEALEAAKRLYLQTFGRHLGMEPAGEIRSVVELVHRLASLIDVPDSADAVAVFMLWMGDGADLKFREGLKRLAK